MLLGQSRVFYSMARDGLLPQWVNNVHPKFQTPWITSIVTGLAVAIPAGWFTVREAGSLVSIGTLLAFVIVSVGILVLRVREPEPGPALQGAHRLVHRPGRRALGALPDGLPAVADLGAADHLVRHRARTVRNVRLPPFPPRHATRPEVLHHSPNGASMSLFRRKSCGLAAGGDRGRSQPQTRPRRGQPDRCSASAPSSAPGIFVLTGQAAANYAGPGHRLLVHPGRHRLRIRRTLLRRVRGNDPDRRVGLHLRLRHPGEFVAWIIGWDLILEYLFAATTVAVGWSGYTVSLAQGHGDQHPRGIHRQRPIPTPWRRTCRGGTSGASSRMDGASTGDVINVPAMFIVP